MINEISIYIPKEESLFTLYAEGKFIKNTSFESFYDIHLDYDYCIILYYTYKYNKRNPNRRLYICCKPEKLSNKNVYNLPNVNDSLSVINQLRGRAFDRFKAAMKFLNIATMGEVYLLPPIYFWKLSQLCQNGKNNLYNIKKLTLMHNPKITFNEEITWE